MGIAYVMPPRNRKQPDGLFENLDPKMERMLRHEFKVDYEFLSNVPVGQIDVERSNKANTRFKILDEDTKNKYVADLERGDKFPPIIGYYGNGGKAKKITVADGRHRVAAHAELGLPLDVYLLDPNTPAGTIVMIAYLCNEKNGLPYTEDERIQHALYFVDNDVSQKDAAARFGIKQAKLKQALDLREANNRAAEARVDRRVWEGLNQTVRARLNAIPTNTVFKKAAMLAHDAKLNTTEAVQLVVDLRKTKDEEKQIKLLDIRRRELKEQIQSTAGGLKSSRALQTPKGRISLATSLVSGIPEDVSVVAKTYQGPEREETADQCQDIGDWFHELAEALRA